MPVVHQLAHTGSAILSEDDCKRNEHRRGNEIPTPSPARGGRGARATEARHACRAARRARASSSAIGGGVVARQLVGLPPPAILLAAGAAAGRGSRAHRQPNLHLRRGVGAATVLRAEAVAEAGLDDAVRQEDDPSKEDDDAHPQHDGGHGLARLGGVDEDPSHEEQRRGAEAPEGRPGPRGERRRGEALDLVGLAAGGRPHRLPDAQEGKHDLQHEAHRQAGDGHAGDAPRRVGPGDHDVRQEPGDQAHAEGQHAEGRTAERT
mmetsp:Transcript_96954/g.279019  ORF Transcript_96954/g.279019 Transcript_96954/m.279019 type:complete len:264 (+) Transcript_96954:1835-2626(+)